MKKLLLALILLLPIAACSEVEEIVPLLYPGGAISDPAAGIPSFQPSAPSLPTAPPSRHPPTERETAQALEQAGLAGLGLSPETMRELALSGSLEVDIPALRKQSTFKEAYLYLFSRGWPVYWSSTWASERFFTMFDFVSENLERRQVALLLQRMLREMIHSSLEQYHYSTGDLKEAAWRNTAFLCIAARLLDPDAPTPFIVSGIVRKELDLIQAADTEAPSPLLSLDAKENPCIGKTRFGCLDYRLFRNHPFIRFYPARRNLHQAMLWLSQPGLPLREKLPFLQSVLMTDCVKRAQVLRDQRPIPAWRIWLMIVRFYAFLYRTEPAPDFVQMDSLLRQNLPESFDENYFLNTVKLEELERLQPQFADFRQGEFHFFPRLAEDLAPYFGSLVYPAVGPDTGNPLYAGFLIPNLSADCGPMDLQKSRRRLLSCSGLTPDDYGFLFCNANDLAFRDPRVMEVFRPLPCAEDLLNALDWPSSADGAPGYCRYTRNLNQLRQQLRTRAANDWSVTMADLTVWMMRPYANTPLSLRPKSRTGPPLSSHPPVDLLLQLRPTPSIRKENKSSPDRTRSLQQALLEPNPGHYHRLMEATEYYRHLIMMAGFSDLVLDDILLQYSAVAERMEQIAAQNSARDPLSPAQAQYIRSLDQRMDLLESRLMGYFPGYPNTRFLRLYPRWTPLWSSPDMRTQRVAIMGDFRLHVLLLRDSPDGFHVRLAPQPAYFETESSSSRFFSPQEIAEILRKNVPKQFPAGD
jgi:hypothetical protein